MAFVATLSATPTPNADANPIEDAERQTSHGAAAADVPPVGAASVAVMDAGSGAILFERGSHERRAPASVTKIMTALLTLEVVPPAAEQNVVTSATDARAMPGSSVMGLWPAAGVTLRDLLYGLMLPSGNDAAIELARNLAPSEAAFVDRMNDRAVEIGMKDTHFENPHGLDDPQHYSSAFDMALLTRHAMNDPRFRTLVGATDYQLSPPFDYTLHNGNSLLGTYPGATGVKIGWTDEAGWTFVASAARAGREIIVSLMNTQDRDADAAALLDWAFTQPPPPPPPAPVPDVLIHPSPGLCNWTTGCSRWSRPHASWGSRIHEES